MSAATTGGRRHRTGYHDAAWGAVAVLSLVFLLNALVTPLWRLVFGDVSWVLLLLTPLNLLLSGLVLVGSWRRTSWGGTGRAGNLDTVR